jgi:hypothetical protein
MTTDTIDRPQTAVATTEATPATLRETALASFVQIRAHAARLAEKYRNVAYDLKTSKGMTEAKAARHELRQDGRFAVQKLRDRLKDEANDLKRVVATEADEVIKLIAPVEDALHEQITGREREIEDERQARIAAEAARIAATDAKIEAEYDGWVQRCQSEGMTAERIETGIHMLENGAPADWGDRNAKAAEVKAQTLATMRTLRDQATARELAAENARLARELAEQRAAMEAQAAELARAKADELAKAQALKDEDERKAREAEAVEAANIRQIEALAAEQRADEARAARLQEATDEAKTIVRAIAALAPAPIVEATAQPVPVEPPATTPAAAPAEPAPATLTLGMIRERLQFALTEAFMLEVLGIEPAGRKGPAVLFAESQWPAIKASLIEHVKALP